MTFHMSSIVAYLIQQISGCQTLRVFATSLLPFHLTGNTLCSAASSNFLGTEVFFQRHGLNPLKTEIKRSWFNGKLLLHRDI